MRFQPTEQHALPARDIMLPNSYELLHRPDLPFSRPVKRVAGGRYDRPIGTATKMPIGLLSKVHNHYSSSVQSDRDVSAYPCSQVDLGLQI